MMGNAPQHNYLPETRFYRLPHVLEKLQVSRSTIWGWVKAGKFPKPVKLGEKTTVWNAADVEAWSQDRILASQKGE